MWVCWRPPAWAVGVGACAPVLRWGTRLCSWSSRGDRWEGGQVTLNIPSAPATEQPLTPSITSTHSLQHTIWPCILSQEHRVMDDFRHKYSTTLRHTASPGQKQETKRSKTMSYFMHKTQGFNNHKMTPMTHFMFHRRKNNSYRFGTTWGIVNNFINLKFRIVFIFFFFWVSYLFKEEMWVVDKQFISLI